MHEHSPTKDVFQQVFKHITHLFAKQIPSCLNFHTFQHTLEVIKASNEICLQSNLTLLEIEVVLIAACFHDTGYLSTYVSHEEESKKIASEYLFSIAYGVEKIQQVLECIEATKVPQKPMNTLQQVLCDADLFHLSLTDYKEKEQQLRIEWECIFSKKYTDKEWDIENLQFLNAHQYFTLYGKNILQPAKQANVMELQNRLKDL